MWGGVINTKISRIFIKNIVNLQDSSPCVRGPCDGGHDHTSLHTLVNL